MHHVEWLKHICVEDITVFNQKVFFEKKRYRSEENRYCLSKDSFKDTKLYIIKIILVYRVWSKMALSPIRTLYNVAKNKYFFRKDTVYGRISAPVYFHPFRLHRQCQRGSHRPSSIQTLDGSI